MADGVHRRRRVLPAAAARAHSADRLPAGRQPAARRTRLRQSLHVRRQLGVQRRRRGRRQPRVSSTSARPVRRSDVSTTSSWRSAGRQRLDAQQSSYESRRSRYVVLVALNASLTSRDAMTTEHIRHLATGVPLYKAVYASPLN